MITVKESLLDQKAALTFKLENKRAVATGILETATTTFALLIAVRVFNADATVKWLASSGESIGFLLSPFIVGIVSTFGLKTTRGAAAIAVIGFFAYLFSAASSNVWVFVFGTMLGAGCRTMVLPLNTQIYQDNYPESIRGRLYSQSTFIKLIATVIFSYLAGKLLKEKIDLYFLILLSFAFSHLFAAVMFRRCPGKIIKKSHPNILHCFSYLRDDSIFRNTVCCWMIMGFANLIMFPLRVDYLANPKYNLNFSETYIALVISVIPSVVRIFMTPLWGKLFDRMNFFSLRFSANLCFILSILSFFTSTTFYGLIVGALCYGVAYAGGDVAWNLWVTKFAPADKVAEYMSVHVFLTGVRAFFAPLVAFHLVEVYSITTIGYICMGMIAASSVFLIPGYRFKTNVILDKVEQPYFKEVN